MLDRNIVSRSRIPVVGNALPIPDSVLSITERILSQASRVNQNTNSDLFSKQMLDNLGIIAPNFPWTPLSLPLRLRNNDISFLDDTSKLCRMMLIMLKTIPVIAVNIQNDDFQNIPLGLYMPRERIILLNSNLIKNNSSAQSLQNIADRAHEDPYIFLSVKVLIHELAHAVMDVNNYGLPENFSQKYRQYTRSKFCEETCVTSISIKFNPEHFYWEITNAPVNFYHIREESFANLITLRVISDSKRQRINGLLPFTKEMISSEPASYRLALYLPPDNKISGWVRAKIDVEIDKQPAEQWMDAAEGLLNGTLTKAYECRLFREQEERLQLPWR